MRSEKVRIGRNSNIAVYSFSSESDLVQYCAAKIEEYNAGAMDNETSDKAQIARLVSCDYQEEKNYKKWYGEGVKHYSDANNLLINGFVKDVKEMKDAYKHAAAVNPITKKTLHYCGAVPSVADYIAGRPRDMRRTITTVQNSKIANIYVEFGASQQKNAKQILEASLKVASYIGGMEKAGYSVNLHAIRVQEQREGYYSCFDLKLKDASNRANVSRFLFPLCHPSFQRVFNFLTLAINAKDCNLNRATYGSGSYHEGYQIVAALLPKDAIYISIEKSIEGVTIEAQQARFKDAQGMKRITEGRPLKA